MKIKRRPFEEITIGRFTFGVTGDQYWPLKITLDVAEFHNAIRIIGQEKLNKEQTVALRDALTEIIELTESKELEEGNGQS